MAKTGPDSARRAIEMLFAFEQKPVSTVRELSESLAMPAPSTHRYVALLREMGLIDEAQPGHYRLTMRVAALGQAARRATSLIDVAQPFMQALSDRTGETVLLIQPVAGLPVCTHRVEAQQRLRLSFEIGQNLPPLRGASAHLLLAALPDGDRRKYVDDALARGDLAPVSGIDDFLAEVQRDAERGWAVSSEEIDEGVWSAASMLRSGGRFLGTLSVPCPTFRVNEEKASMIIHSVRQTANEITKALGS